MKARTRLAPAFISGSEEKKDTQLFIKDETKDERYLRYKNNAIVALSVFAILISAVAVLLTGLQYTSVYYWTTVSYVQSSQPMTVSPFAFYIGGANIPLNLQIPNDLTNYVGKVYRVWAVDAGHAHTVTSGTATFDMVGSKVMTFGGAIGDGFMFEVISPNRIVIISATNVTPS